MDNKENKKSTKKRNIFKKDKTKKFKNNKLINFFPLIIIVIIAIVLFFLYYIFNTYNEALLIENDGFFAQSSAVVNTLSSGKKEDVNSKVGTVSVKENDYIYSTPLNYYVDNNKKNKVDIYYPLFTNDGLSIINYNDEINLINKDFGRIIGYKELVFSYGRAYEMQNYTQIDNEKYLLINYPTGVYINLYDLRINTVANEYIIPVNSFIFFDDEDIYYYERTEGDFVKRIIEDVDELSTITFYYFGGEEEYQYSYKDFLVGLGEYTEEVYIPEKPIIDVEDQEEVEDPKPKPPVDKEEEAEWIKPVVTAKKFTASVYTASSELSIYDPTGAIVEAPTFELYVNTKTYSRRTFYNSGPLTISGLTPDTEFEIVGKYTYLDKDMTTRKIVYFYNDTIETLGVTELEPIDISFENGETYSNKVELKNLQIKSDLRAETLVGTRTVTITIGDDNYNLSKDDVTKLLNGGTIEKISSGAGVESNSTVNFTINFLDKAGNKLPIKNNTGTARTCKKAPSIIVSVAQNMVDYVELGLKLRNDDEVKLNNYHYIVVNSAGEIIKEDTLTDDTNSLRLQDLDPNQIFTMYSYADIDLEDGKGVQTNYELGNVKFTTLPISSLGYVNFDISQDVVTYNASTISLAINTKKTDQRLINILTNVRVELYKDETEELIKEVKLSEEELSTIKNEEAISLSFDNLESNVKYNVEVQTEFKQGSTVIELDTVHDFTDFETKKLPAIVLIQNKFTTSTLIDFDCKITDIDHAILSNYARIELRNGSNKLIDSRTISVNTDDFIRITYTDLFANDNYTIYFYADEYNETNNNINFQSKYELHKEAVTTTEGISGKLELSSSLRVATGKNLLDLNSELKWVQTGIYYTVPRTIDDEGNMHIYAKTGSAGYMYDLSDYYGEFITATFEIQAITPLPENYDIYFVNYVTGTTNQSYGIKLEDIPTEKSKKFTVTFKVGYYKDNGIYRAHTTMYHGKHNTEFAGFYISGGDTKLSEYVVKNLEMHISGEEKEVDLSNITIEQGYYNNTGAENNTASYLTKRARVKGALPIEGGKKYTFEFGNGTDEYDAIIYFAKDGKVASTSPASYSFSSGATIEIPKGVDAYVYFRYHKDQDDIDQSTINLKITEIKLDENSVKEDYTYDLVTKVKTTVIDQRDEITNNTYYITIYNEAGKQVKRYEYEELVDTDRVEEVIKELDLEEHKNYTVELGIEVRGRYYVLDSFELSTDDEVQGISNTDDWAFIQPHGKYIANNDIDLTNYTDQILGFGYRYFYGTIDFQGYKVTVNTAPTAAFSKIGRVEKTAVIKNLVLDINLDNDYNKANTNGFISNNYGTLENIIINVYDTRKNTINDSNMALFCYTNQIWGKINNFVINIHDNKLNLYQGSAILVRDNYGKVTNGYIYGENGVAYNDVSGATNRQIGLLQRYGGVKSEVNHVYSLAGLEFPKNNTYDLSGILTWETYGSVKNSYVTSNTNAYHLEVGPLVGYPRTTSSLSNLYYYSDYIYTADKQEKIKAAQLNEPDFQKSVLGDQFNVDDMLTLGYYPQVIFTSKKMPKQDYLELPPYTDDELVDITNFEILSQTNNEATVQVMVNNVNGENIEEISIANLKTEILEQNFSGGKSTVKIKVSNPEVFVSRYEVKSITSSFSGYRSTRTYQSNEKFLFVDFYKEIHEIKDWVGINDGLNQNYKLMQDLDFDNYGKNDFYITNTFTGTIDGNGHTIRNLKLNDNKAGLFFQMNGTLENIFFENVEKTYEKNTYTNYGAIIGYSNSVARITNVHIKNIKMEVPATRTGTIYVGGLLGYSATAKITDSSVTDVEIKSNAQVTTIYVGALVGYSNGSTITNSYAQNVNINIAGANYANGVGGLVGGEVSTVGTITNCYTTGSITSTELYTGGIVGYTTGYVTNSYSSVDLNSSLYYVGGIAGQEVTASYLEGNLYVGNIYTKSNDNIISRIANEIVVPENNYTINSTLINGVRSDVSTGETILDTQALYDPATYTDIIYFGDSYDYSEVSEGCLPKLYHYGTEDLLPNQLDNKVGKKNFTVNTVDIQKHVTDATVALVIDNPNNYEIKSVTIDDANVTIKKNNTQNNQTNLELDVTPQKYYDYYKLSKITYTTEDGSTEQSELASIRLGMTFYKELNSFDDWQNVSTSDAENYILKNDIDFTDKENIKTGVVFNRLESESDDVTRTLKGINLQITTSQNDVNIIKRIDTKLSHINFENITITDKPTANNSYDGIILNNYAELANVSFKDITIDMKTDNYVGIIARNNGNNTHDIKLENVTVSGTSYVSGFIAYTKNSVNRFYNNITATKMTVTGTKSYTGGIIGRADLSIGSQEKEIRGITISDSTITGLEYVGGIVAYGVANDSTVDKVTVKGKNNVGGAVGYQGSSYMFGLTVKNSTIEGSDTRIGGVVGASFYIYDSYVFDSHVTGTGIATTSVGGIAGAEIGANYVILGRCGVKNTDITSGGTSTGGLAGSSTSIAQNSYVYKATISGLSKTGGVVGSVTSGSVYDSRVSESLVTSSTDYAGGIVGSIDNTLSEGSVREVTVEDTDVVGNSHVGGFFGEVKREFINPQNDYSLYFAGRVKAESGKDYGIGSGDARNSQVLSLARIGFYEKDLLQDQKIDTLGVDEEKQGNNLITTLTKGYIGTDGKVTTNYSYPNAEYSNKINLQKGKSYKLDIDVIGNKADWFRIYLYDTNGKYISEFMSGSANPYFTYYHRTSNVRTVTFTVVKNCYIIVDFIERQDITSYELKEITYEKDKIPKTELLSYEELRDPNLWSRYINEEKTDLYYSSYFALNSSYWDPSPVNDDVDVHEVTIKDLSNDKHNATAKVTAIDEDGLLFDGGADNIVTINNGFTLPDSFTISMNVTSFSTRSYQYIFSVGNFDQKKGLGIFIHSKTIYVHINGSHYNTNHTIPLYEEANITVTYDGKKHLIVYIDGEKVYEHTNTVILNKDGITDYYVGHDVKYNTATNKFMGHIRDLCLYNKVLSDEEVKNSYKSATGIINQESLALHYDFAAADIMQEGHYPILKWDVSGVTYEFKAQEEVPLPDGKDYEAKDYKANSVSTFGLSSIYNSTLDSNYHVYPSGVNSLNIEFDNLPVRTKISYKYGDYVQEAVEITDRVYSIYYDYSDDIEITISNAFSSNTQTFKKEDIRKNLAIVNDDYYFLKDTTLYKNGTELEHDITNLYNTLALNKNGDIYNLKTGEYQTPYKKQGILPAKMSLYESKINDYSIKSYYNYSIVSGTGKDPVVRDGRIILRNDKVYVINRNDNIVNNDLIINTYNNHEYQIALEDTNEIYSYKTAIKYPSGFINANIVDIAYDYESDDPIMLVLYDNGSIVGFNYYNGHKVYEYGSKPKISLLKYIGLGLSQNTDYIKISEASYEDSMKLQDKLDNLTVTDILDKLNAGNITSSENPPEDVEPVENEDRDMTNVTTYSNNISEKYYVSYDSSKDEYEVYNLDDILNTENEMVVNQKIKIKSDSYLYSYFYTDTNNEFFSKNKVLVYLAIITLIFVNLFVLVIKLKNKGLNRKDGDDNNETT